MNYKIVSIKRTNAIFLAIVLVTGTITLLFSSSSFITANAQAEPYYEMDNNKYKKSYGKDNAFDISKKELSLVYDKNPQIINKIQELVEQYKKLKPFVYDENLQITQLTTDELNFPTGIDFLAEDDILVIEKNTGQVKNT